MHDNVLWFDIGNNTWRSSSVDTGRTAFKSVFLYRRSRAAVVNIVSVSGREIIYNDSMIIRTGIGCLSSDAEADMTS